MLALGGGLHADVRQTQHVPNRWGSAMIAANRADSSTDRPISFGPFRLFPRQRLLLESGKPVRLGSRATDLLIALLERPGELLSKDELISRACPAPMSSKET